MSGGHGKKIFELRNILRLQAFFKKRGTHAQLLTCSRLFIKCKCIAYIYPRLGNLKELCNVPYWLDKQKNR